MEGTSVYVHFEGEAGIYYAYQFDMMARGILFGAVVPRQYKVLHSQVNTKECSVDLILTNGGSPVNIEKIRDFVTKYWGDVKVGPCSSKILQFPDRAQSAT